MKGAGVFRSQVGSGDGEVNGEALGGGRAGGRDGHSIAQGRDGDVPRSMVLSLGSCASARGGLERDDWRW